MGSAPVGVQCPLTRWVSWLLGLVLVSWAFARVGVHHLSLRLPYLSVFPFTLLHLPLVFIRVSFLRLMYLHPSVDPSLIVWWVSRFGTGFGIPDEVVPEAEYGGAWSRNLVSNFGPARGLNQWYSGAGTRGNAVPALFSGRERDPSLFCSISGIFEYNNNNCQ